MKTRNWLAGIATIASLSMASLSYAGWSQLQPFVGNHGLLAFYKTEDVQDGEYTIHKIFLVNASGDPDGLFGGISCNNKYLGIVSVESKNISPLELVFNDRLKTSRRAAGPLGGS
jgi:hypothetical protein